MTLDSDELSVPTKNQRPLSASLQADLAPVRSGEGYRVWVTGCSDKESCQQANGVLKPDLQMCRPPGSQVSAVLKDFLVLLRIWLRLGT